MFKISKEQVEKVLAVLGEVPAKLSYDAIQILATLEKLEELVKDENSQE